MFDRKFETSVPISLGMALFFRDGIMLILIRSNFHDKILVWNVLSYPKNYVGIKLAWLAGYAAAVKWILCSEARAASATPGHFEKCITHLLAVLSDCATSFDPDWRSPCHVVSSVSLNCGFLSISCTFGHIIIKIEIFYSVQPTHCLSAAQTSSRRSPVLPMGVSLSSSNASRSIW